MIKFNRNEIIFSNKKTNSTLDNPNLSYRGDKDFLIYLKDFIAENLSSLVENIVFEVA